MFCDEMMIEKKRCTKLLLEIILQVLIKQKASKRKIERK
jgi:hypothetical protein